MQKIATQVRKLMPKRSTTPSARNNRTLSSQTIITPAPRNKMTRSRSLPIPPERDSGGRLKMSSHSHENSDDNRCEENDIVESALRATRDAEKMYRDAFRLQQAAEKRLRERDEMLARASKSPQVRARVRIRLEHTPHTDRARHPRCTSPQPFNLSTRKRTSNSK